MEPLPSMDSHACERAHTQRRERLRDSGWFLDNTSKTTARKKNVHLKVDGQKTEDHMPLSCTWLLHVYIYNFCCLPILGLVVVVVIYYSAAIPPMYTSTTFFPSNLVFPKKTFPGSFFAVRHSPPPLFRPPTLLPPCESSGNPPCPPPSHRDSIHPHPSQRRRLRYGRYVDFF